MRRVVQVVAGLDRGQDVGLLATQVLARGREHAGVAVVRVRHCVSDCADVVGDLRQDLIQAVAPGRAEGVAARRLARRRDERVALLGAVRPEHGVVPEGLREAPDVVRRDHPLCLERRVDGEARGIVVGRLLLELVRVHLVQMLHDGVVVLRENQDSHENPDGCQDD